MLPRCLFWYAYIFWAMCVARVMIDYKMVKNTNLSECCPARRRRLVPWKGVCVVRVRVIT